MNIDDARAFEAIAQGRTDTGPRANRKAKALTFVACLFGALIPFLLNPNRGQFISDITGLFTRFDWMAFLGLALPLGVFGAFWIFIIISQRKARLTNPAFNEPSTIALDRQAMSQSAGTLSTRVEWRGMEKVTATNDHLCFFVSDNNGFVVPRRAFDNDDDWHSYVDFARQQWQNAQPVKPPIANA